MPDRPRAPVHAQRWRITYCRRRDAPDLPQRELLAVWQQTVEAAGFGTDAHASPPSRVLLAAPIPNGMTADRELADLFLAQRHTAADVRARLGDGLPAGHGLVGLHDVWVGEPALPGLVVAADYRIGIGTADGEPAPSMGDLATATDTLLASTTLERGRARPEASASANLRSLIDDVRPIADGCVWMRLRSDPALGTGRPDEVLLALGRVLRREIHPTAQHRERLWLRGEFEERSRHG